MWNRIEIVLWMVQSMWHSADMYDIMGFSDCDWKFRNCLEKKEIEKLAGGIL